MLIRCLVCGTLHLWNDAGLALPPAMGYYCPTCCRVIDAEVVTDPAILAAYALNKDKWVANHMEGLGPLDP